MSCENKSKPLRVRCIISLSRMRKKADPALAGTKQIFSIAPQTSGSGLGAFKLIILDEADAMTATAQMALRRIMEKYTANTRFCIIANYTHKLSPALLSRCTRFRFSPLKEADIRSLVDQVVEKEHVRIQPEAVDSLVKLSKGDMRRALNVLQACHASSQSPLTAMVDLQPANNTRHTAPSAKRTQGPTTARARNDHQRDHLRLHCRTSPVRYPRDRLYASSHQRCHVVSDDAQHAQGQQGTGLG